MNANQPDTQTAPATDIRILESSPTQVDYPCGHKGPEWFRLTMFGELTGILKKRPECPKCLIDKLNQFAIRCASCGKIIVPGDGVALYDIELNKELLDHIEVGTLIDSQTALGCLRMKCCPSGGFFGGNWTENGYVQR